jgi:hypothetical protein
VGHKTKAEKERIESDLEILMNITQELAERNPKLIALEDKFPLRFINKAYAFGDNLDKDAEYYEEYDQVFSKCYGDVFPTYPVPVERHDEKEKVPSEIILKVDLNYSKDEIMYEIERIIIKSLKEYRKNRRFKFKRRNPSKWLDYLEIWDLRGGYPPWRKFDDGFKASVDRTKGRPWTYEEIAKYLYPETVEGPEELEKAINRVKKQYRGAYKLVMGDDYNPQQINDKLDKLGYREQGEIVNCSNCPDRSICEELCPPMLESLEKEDVKRKELLVSNPNKTDLDEFYKSKKKPSADNQFS